MSNPFEEDDEILVVFVLSNSKPSNKLTYILKTDPVFQNYIREKTVGIFYMEVKEGDLSSDITKEWLEFSQPQLFPTIIRYRMVDNSWEEVVRLVGNAPINTVIEYIWS